MSNEIETLHDSTHRKDIDRVGLSASSRLALDELVLDGHFKDSISCYRFAVALAIKENLDIQNHKVERPAGHMYLISQFDPESAFAAVIEELMPEYRDEKYRALEKYADLGTILLNEKVNQSGSIIF